MIPNSIRWRLPLSYAAIALLTAVALGAVLITMLRGYYYRQELDYLTGNADAIGTEIDRLLENDLPLDALQSQLAAFAFLSQTRVRLLSPEGDALADSGSLDQNGGEGAVLVEAFTNDPVSSGAFEAPLQERDPSLYQSSIVVVNRLFSGQFQEQVMMTRTEEVNSQTIVTTQRAVERRLVSQLPVTGTPYGFGLGAGTSAGDARSALVVRQEIPGNAGELRGYVELSQGPAYGLDILSRVAWGWSFAGGTAVLLAAIVGWFASRRMSGPLLALTGVTARMESGDLSARAPESRQDEVGQLSQSFNRMANRVEDTIVALRRFVADAAHELNTPLTALRTDLELLGEEQTKPEQKVRVNRAQTQLARLEALTKGLLDLSRLEANKTAGPHSRIDLNQLAQGAAELSASRAEQAGLTFIFEPNRQAIPLTGSEPLLQQAIGNLLDNAIKFTPEGGEIRMSTQRQGDWGMVYVRDNGIGILDEDMDGLFGRFHRGRNVANIPGSGLGLAIVRAVAEGHQGEVTVENGPNRSVFTLQLPLTVPATMREASW